MTVRILLADDHELFAEGLRGLLGAEPDVDVIGDARDGRTAVERAVATKPDVVLMDLSMPGLNGLEATRQILARSPGVKVLCLSMHAESSMVRGALHAGAVGYLLKDCALSELRRAIYIVAAGEVYLSPGIAATVLDAYKAGRSQLGEHSAFSLLTDREREVLQLLAEGLSTREVAARLHLSVKTIGTHREHLMAKLDIHSVAGLTKYAIREGLTSLAGGLR